MLLYAAGVTPPCNHAFIIVLYHVCHTEKILTSLDRYAIIIGSNRYSLQNTTKINGGKRHVSRDTRCGDIATGIALRLYRAGIRLVLTDLPQPTPIRRRVCFGEAIRLAQTAVEGVQPRRADTAAEAAALTEQGIIAVLADPAAGCVQELHPDALVDAILAKKNLGTHITDAPIVIAVGPGFTAGVDCHAAVETMRGHTLGRVLYTGSPLPNTGVPGVIGGHAAERVLRAPADGLFEPCREIGDLVEMGDTIAYVAGKPMKTTITGCLRGLLQAGVPVHEGMKSGDVDPRGKRENCDTASDKALAVGGFVLSAFVHFSNVFH